MTASKVIHDGGQGGEECQEMGGIVEIGEIVRNGGDYYPLPIIL